MSGDLKLSRFVVEGPLVRHRSTGGVCRLIFCSRTASPLVLTEALWRRVSARPDIELPATLQERLLKEQILVHRDVDELLDVIRDNQEAILTSKVLYHVIQPTAACQLGCGYCGQEHTSQLMSPGTQQRLLDRLRAQLSTLSYSSLSIGWFGAEPLMGLNVIRTLTPRLIALAQEHGALYSAKIVTNGLRLTPEIARELAEQHRVGRAEITLDGPPAIHDARRPTKAGLPTFTRIMTNLSALRTEVNDLQIVIRCNVDRQNADYVADLIDLLAIAGLQDRVQFYIAPIHAWGNTADEAALSHDEFGRWEIEWLAHLHNRGFPTGLFPERKQIVCLAVRRDGELTDAFGAIFNCTEVSYVPSYGVPNQFAAENDSPEASRRLLFRSFNEDILNGRQTSCQSCAMLPVCGGACPKLWSEGRVPCPSAKANIGERLLLWYAIQSAHETAAVKGSAMGISATPL